MKYSGILILFVCSFVLLYSANSYSQCTDSISNNRNNLGLYGGTSFELSYTSGGRLFSSVQFLYYTDDTCSTWKHAFPNDSLVFDCNNRGWEGQANKILSNTKSWVAVHTISNTGNITASVVSFSEGDSGSWKTAMDPTLLSEYGYSVNKVTAIGLSDYFVYTGLGPVITLTDTVAIDTLKHIIDISSAISGITDSANIIAIAAANHPSGFPFYILVDTSGAGGINGGILYKYNGSVFSLLSFPSEIKIVDKIFTHPHNILGDTLFISGLDSLNESLVFKSYNGGSTWVEITYNGTYGSFGLSDVDYSAVWKSSAPTGDGIILNCSGVYVSDDLGNTWKTAGLPAAGLAVNPSDINTVAKSFSLKVNMSSTGITGTYAKKKNEGLDAVIVFKISRTKKKGAFYLATNMGMAYTSAYNDNNVDPFDKWKAPYGEFPLNSIQLSSSEMLKTVAINPYDSLNVITGSNKGFYVTQIGSKGFGLVSPSGYMDHFVNDIEFIDSLSAVAVCGGNEVDSSGNIWRSNDKGNTWNNVSPPGFMNGNVVAIAYGSNDTVIYVGTGFTGFSKGILWKSSDLGFTWDSVNTGPSDFPAFSENGLPITDIAIDLRGTDTLYIAAAGGDEKSAVVSSSDGGKTYHYINFYASSSGLVAHSIAIYPSNPDSVFMAIGKNLGIYYLPTDTFNYVASYFPEEELYDICIGSILVGSTTGFYSIELEGYDDINVGIHKNINLEENILGQNFPNPFSTNTTIPLFISGNMGNASLLIMSAVGKQVSEYIITEKGKTYMNVENNALSNGIYFYMLKIDNVILASRKMIISR